jgi:hypothetical protein
MEKKVIRGGAWCIYPAEAEFRAANSKGLHCQGIDLGFRVVKGKARL